MNGMLMMLKSFGINPDEILAQADGIRQLAQETRDTMVRIEQNQKRILVLLGDKPDASEGAENGDETNADNSRTIINAA